MKDNIYISVVVISFNGIEFIEDCLATVQTSLNNINSEILVVDNGSADGTVELIENKFPNIRVLKNADNLGFAKAVNQGFEMTSGVYIVLLYLDTSIVGI